MEVDARGLPEFLEALRSALGQIDRFPWSGGVWRDGDDPRVRALLVGPYWLIYVVHDEHVSVELLQHARRRPGAADLTLLP
ncbi:MAG: hypothetical protein K8S21_13475 [Gemmatimonadetes bacterium]|nr:hypothetical protein [Gemmatimonadota bacterium]